MADQTPPQPKRCPDDGACHHTCLAGCFRVAYCGPLSGVYPGDTWPEDVRRQHQTLYRAQVEEAAALGLTRESPVGGQPQPDTPGDLPREARALVDRVERVLQEWSDASEPRRAEIWQAMHDQADVVRDVLDAPAPRPDTPTDPEALAERFHAEYCDSIAGCRDLAEHALTAHLADSVRDADWFRDLARFAVTAVAGVRGEPHTTPTGGVSPTMRRDLRRAIATDIYRVAQHAPMTLTADGGETAALLAELALKRVETSDIGDYPLVRPKGGGRR